MNNPSNGVEQTISPELIKEVCATRLDAFAQYYFPHYLKKPMSPLHRYLYKVLSKAIIENKPTKRVVVAPRGNSKSSVVSTIFPLWCICYGYEKFIIMVSDTANQAEAFLLNVKDELESNERLRKDFPEATGEGKMWRKEEIITKNGVRVLTLGSGSKIRGRMVGSNRSGLILFDDIENSEDVISPTRRDFLRYDWFNKDVQFAGGENTKMIIVGTILGKDALLNAIRDPNQYPDWDSKIFKAVYQFSDSPLWEDWKKLIRNSIDPNRIETAKKFFEDHKEEMLDGVKVLWPEGDPYYNLMLDKLRDESAFLAEKQSNPIDYTKIIVPFDQITFVDFMEDKYLQCLNRCHFFAALDPSLGKKSKRGDNSVIMVAGRDSKSGIIFICEIYRGRISVDAQIDLLIKLHGKYKFSKVACETNMAQFVIAENIRKKSRELGVYIPLIEVYQHHDKKMRFEGIAPFLKDGTVVFDTREYKSNPVYKDSVDELTTFTGLGDLHDDVADACVLVFDVAKAPKFKLLTRQTRQYD